jgi:Uncharacterised protein, DegV family COG1307
VPVLVIVNCVTFWDLCEFTPEALRRAQLEGGRIGTSQVNLADFETLYSSLLERYGQRIWVHMSSKVSSTDTTAKLLAKRFADRVQPIDSHSPNARPEGRSTLKEHSRSTFTDHGLAVDPKSSGVKTLYAVQVAQLL